MSRLTRIFRQHPLALCGAVAALVIVLDQWSKELVIRELGPEAGRGIVTLVPGVLRLLWVRNTGSAFGMFQGGSEIIKFLAIGAVILLAAYFFRSAKRDWLIALALGLQLGGALGNLIDRFRHGYVVDWIDFPRFPTFNLADSAITVGVVLLMYGLLFRVQQSPAAGRERAPAWTPVDGVEP